ncbi:hypothetical protein F4821DRAFT_273606 [Hypoxylon rubiginosum]|uniref:Uncharacterized protein n=1 Tax=Hypoxylon rubiginosum TaxID=110542 RepID=A0ACC0CKD0_9PEZI|nr:hypothetical protein F4821DRAFT_273606 [Hypoxylon rubiginosum]
MRWPPIYWHDVEITSPAFFATENSYDEIRRVVNALNEKWWLYAPKAAGLHVHYGRGSDWIPFEHIRKMSALLYAADPIIAQMHPEHRRRCDFSQSNRLYSALAYGVSPVLAERKYRGEYDGQVGQEAEPIYPDNLDSRLPEGRPTRTRAPTFPTVFKRGSLKSYEFDQGTFDGTGRFGLRNIQAEDLVPNPDRSKPLKIPVGLLQILACDKAPQVAILQQNFRNNRSAYSFDAYGRLYRTARPAKRTVEFRQAPGTVDPDEIIAQCKICVGLGDFAGSTDTTELFKLIQDLISADGNPSWYDVFDLLFELDLVEEARIIQRRVARDNDIEIIDEIIAASSSGLKLGI